MTQIVRNLRRALNHALSRRSRTGPPQACALWVRRSHSRGGLEPARVHPLAQQMAEVLQHGLQVLEIHQQPLRLLALCRPDAKRVAQLLLMVYPIPARCGAALGEFEMLEIMTELVLLSDQQLGDCASALRCEVTAAQEADVVIDVGPGDISVHGAPPHYRDTCNNITANREI